MSYTKNTWQCGDVITADKQKSAVRVGVAPH